jgi:hypothetical protein
MQDTTSLLGNENLNPERGYLQSSGDNNIDNLFHFMAGLLPFFIQNAVILEVIVLANYFGFLLYFIFFFLMYVLFIIFF